MKTILIPVDFTDASTNALRYAASLSCDIAVDRVILLKSFYTSLYADMLPSADYIPVAAAGVQQERVKTQDQLQAVIKDLFGNCSKDLKVQIASSELPLLRAVHQLIEDEKPNLLILGSDNRSYLNESYIGEQVISIAKTSSVPALIIPSKVNYQKIERALIPFDFAAASRYSSLKGLQRLGWFKPELMVLNIDPKQEHLTHEAEHASVLKEYLTDYPYQVYYSDHQNTTQGILNFAGAHDVQLLVALPGKHSFFYRLTHKSITDALALNSHHPILILK